MDLIKLVIKGISFSQTQTGAYALILKEEKGERQIPIIIGGFEAQSIAIGLEKELKPSRPLTHDLFISFSEAFNVKVQHIKIYRFEEGVFFSKIICEAEKGYTEIDARTSDAIAIGMRVNAPIYTTEDIINRAGIVLDTSIEMDMASMDEDEENDIEDKIIDVLFNESDSFKKLETQELQDLLKQAIAEEDYETAALINNELEKRK